ncbi:15-hydroxyprostaglandin dehydrogenase (NAD(+)) like protein [Zymoseptoria brevis]|uniref:15-hydroxyprostaglandin dehydrogenase (NAD(+)) like protein n=1 Tax=Zymoseptoria brevis TaxID=1047168 RepID=A0A0F4G9K6_9PEZI|nr:15-hydroxyprostaglandin dehydrogenase (NAD(+)) like protein [Zymoseptoria brevis]
MSRPTALITGGASGIGLAVAEHLIQFHGYRIAIFDGHAGCGAEAVSTLDAENCLFLQADVTDYDAQSKAFVHAFEWGSNRLGLFFANAGVGDGESLYKDINVDEATGLPKPLTLRVIDVNINAIIQGINLARHFFLEKNNTRGGRIVVTSSSLELYPAHCIPLYAASKHALVGLVRSLAPVYAKDGISINALDPALIETNLMPAHLRHLWDREQLTPLSTALKAFDVILQDAKLTGQTMELALGNVILKP